jgi:4-amino-4-deoxy-L-arabinose transferase-like glycosyltransferase
VAARTDIGLGDDGARVFWLLEWWQDPHPVWSGLWLPAHLYLHALLFAVVRDAVWSGVLLSALSAGGTVWILARALEPGWGRWAAGCGALGAALLPVSVAYGATPDVNPVFAFALVASVAAVRHGVQSGRDRWVVVGWACIAAGTWMRFEALVLVPLVALLLWPRRLAATLFAAAGAAPLAFWNLVAPALLGRESTVAVMSRDPTLGGSPLSLAFSYLGALWVAVTLPMLLLGGAGMARAIRARTDRAWMLLPWGHAGALAGALAVLAAGTQPRYFILIATVGAAFAGVGIAGIAAQSRRAGLAALALAAVLLVVTPPLYPSRHDLWIRRDAVLRTLADDTARLAAGRHVVWVGDAGFFYACRIRPPLGRYHSLPRADSDPGLAVAGVGAAPSAVAVVEQSVLARERWDRFLALSSPGWRLEPRFDRGDYRVFELTR